VTESPSDALILDALRTPIGRYGGVLAGVRPDDLAAHVIAAAVDRNGIATSRAWGRCSPVCRSRCRA
jgi:acetyl-CoA acetyltransferase